MSLTRMKLDVLTILFENLQQAQPQLVPSDVIAKKMNLDLSELQQLLKIMDGSGIIKTNSDLQFSLITSQGLHWLSRQRPSEQISLVPGMANI